MLVWPARSNVNFVPSVPLFQVKFIREVQYEIFTCGAFMLRSRAASDRTSLSTSQSRLSIYRPKLNVHGHAHLTAADLLAAPNARGRSKPVDCFAGCRAQTG